MARLRRFLGWSGQQRWAFVVALVLNPLFAALGRGQGFRRAVALSRRLVRLPGRRVRPTDAVAVAEAVKVAARRRVVGVVCLPESLTLLTLLRRRGIAAELRIGVATAGPFAAHAWVEVDGRPVNDTADVAERFAVFERLEV